MGKGIVRIVPQDFFMEADCLQIIFDTKGVIGADRDPADSSFV
jgi:hypothetical protein